MQKLTKVSDRLYYLPPVQVTDRPILGAIVGEEKTVLIDSGNSSQHAKLFLQQLEEIGVRADLLILTHWHWDHVFGMREIAVPSISCKETYANIREMQSLSWEDKDLDQRVEEGTEIPFCADAIKEEFGSERDIQVQLPTIVFENRMTIYVGGVTCEIEHIGGDHSSDSCIVFIPEEKALFLGDCLYANLYAEKWNYTVGKILKLVQQLEKYDADIYFLSHHPAPLPKEEFNSFLQLLKNSALLTQKHDGNEEAIRQEMASTLQRELNEEEIETIGYFVNGW
ncbi:MBL fold metallo-hydrolase [Sporosarcina luteola]|uniref:MBL fold metallo-hydrolase n=1 Tax=Sporosarcina luteola TaxID=582850 RepID=UPI00203B2B38|nr:MBL fold metallo-hydrolase [Sporosarcina luteola]MCM3711399.1 MBL fold metallo-hydrolase [Sporosarcina luteola]